MLKRRNRLDPPCDFLRSVLQVIDFFGTLSCHGLKTEGGSKRLRSALSSRDYGLGNAHHGRVENLCPHTPDHIQCRCEHAHHAHHGDGDST